MSDTSPSTLRDDADLRSRSWNTVITVATILTTGFALAIVIWFAITGHGSSNPQLSNADLNRVFPSGRPDKIEPSHEAPPGPRAFKGYTLTYVNDFKGRSLPSGWDVFTGIPGGDPGGQFARSHVVVQHGVLHLNTWKDPAFENKWATGGLCQCGVAKTYQAYFVRSRVTGAGPNEVELLWPASNSWPPEIDFNESGSTASSTSETVHFGSTDNISQTTVNVDLTKWHTWGVIWTSASIIFTVDGREWALVNLRSEIPKLPMTLDMEQRTECKLNRQCPTSPQSMLIDWVAEYQQT